MIQDIIEEIKVERLRQDEKWGEQNHKAMKWLAILNEEVGEACKAELEADYPAYRAEMVKVAAVALAALESFDRQNTEPYRPARGVAE